MPARDFIACEFAFPSGPDRCGGPARTGSDCMSASRKSQLLLSLGGLAIALLLAAVFTLGSLTLPFEPRRWDQVVVLYALSTFIVAALLVLGLVLTRSLLKLWAERRAPQTSSRVQNTIVLCGSAVSF